MSTAQVTVTRNKRRRSHATRQRRWRRTLYRWARCLDLAAVLLVGMIVLLAVGRLGGCSLSFG